MDGGESGIRTLVGPLESVTYTFNNARVAVDASDAVAPCTGLHRPSTHHAVEGDERIAFTVTNALYVPEIIGPQPLLNRSLWTQDRSPTRWATPFWS
jgi:hypothetical protein